MLIFIKGNNELLNLFVESMASGKSDAVILDYSDPESYYAELTRLDPLITPECSVICFNNIGLVTRSTFHTKHANADISYNTGLYWIKKGVTVYDILVDHPLFYMDTLRLAQFFPALHLLCIDRHQANLIKTSLPALSKRVHFIPHGGMNTNDIRLTSSYSAYAGKLESSPSDNSNTEKKFDLLYLGDGDTGDVLYPSLGIKGINDADFYEYSLDCLINRPYIQEDMIVDSYASANELRLTIGEKLTLTAVLLKTVHYDARRIIKEKLITALADEGLHITVHGRGWEKIALKYPDLITVGGYLHPAECPAVMEQVRFSLSFQPFFTEGAHERVFGAMRCGSICVSNRSRYLESRFRDGEDIIYYDTENLHETALKIKKMLLNNERMQIMINSAASKVQNDSWSDRLESLLTYNILHAP